MPILSTPPLKPWSVAIFESQRSHLTSFVRSKILPLLEHEQCRRVVVRAPVKSGKREMVEYIAMRDSVSHPTRVHAFLSAWHRKADDAQREELKKHNMHVFSISTKKKVEAFFVWFRKQVEEGKQIVLHLDECDHGSGSHQLMSKVWMEVRNKPRITNILYSATPEEVLYSGEVDDEEYQSMMAEFEEGHHIQYTPPEGYCGPRRFLDEDLVEEALPFFYKQGQSFVLSEQAKMIIRDLRCSLITQPNRNLIGLRLSYYELGGIRSEMRDNKAIHQFLKNIASFPELVGVSIIVDKNDISINYPRVRSQKIDWNSPDYWRDTAIGHPILLVYDQTSSRSTEWACHNRMFATHDFRNVIHYTAASQAQERTNHYQQRYDNQFQPIRVYGHRLTFRLSAGLITHTQFLELAYQWFKRKIDRRITGNDAVLYKVHSKAEGNPLHPDCAETGISEAAADLILQKIGCYADVSLSTRIAGKVREIRVYSGSWFPSTKESFDADWARFIANPPNHLDATNSPRNPFISAEAHRLEDGRWLGQHRGWKLLRMEGADLYQDPSPESGLIEPKKLDLGSTGGNRIKVCYKDGNLGVFVARCTGTQQINTLHAVKSMYGETTPA